MRLCAGKDITSNSDIQNPSSMDPLVKGGADLTATRSGVWISNRNACTMEGLRDRSTAVEIGAMVGNFTENRKTWETRGI